MAAQVLHYVNCPKCEADQMAVAKKVVGKNRVAMLFGHCKGCGKMLQGKGHQEYLKASAVVAPVVVSVAAPAPVVSEPAGAEDFDPAKHLQESEGLEDQIVIDTDKPARKKGGFLKVLGVVVFVGVATVGGVAMANRLTGQG